MPRLKKFLRSILKRLHFRMAKSSLLRNFWDRMAMANNPKPIKSKRMVG